jgi:hypothetical protein
VAGEVPHPGNAGNVGLTTRAPMSLVVKPRAYGCVVV